MAAPESRDRVMRVETAATPDLRIPDLAAAVPVRLVPGRLQAQSRERAEMEFWSISQGRRFTSAAEAAGHVTLPEIPAGREDWAAAGMDTTAAVEMALRRVSTGLEAAAEETIIRTSGELGATGES